MNKIAVIDPSSRTLPYDYYYLKELSLYYEVDFYCSESNYNVEFIYAIKDLKNVNTILYPISSTNRVKGILFYLLMLGNILIHYKSYKKIHFFWSIFYFIEIPIFLFIKNKLIFTFHNDTPHDFHGKKYFPYEIIFKLSSKNVFVSECVKHRFIRNYLSKNKSSKIHLIPHGVTGVIPSSIPPNNRLEPDSLEKRIIFWGNIKPYKGVDLFHKLSKDKFFETFSLEIFGKWDPSLKSLKSDLRKSGIKIIDRFLNNDDLEKILSSNSIFILPYIKATQSGVLYTLIFYNQVFVSTNTGDNADFLNSAGLNDLIFDRNDLEELKKSILYCQKNVEIVKEKLIKAKLDFEWNNIISSSVSIYS